MNDRLRRVLLGILAAGLLASAPLPAAANDHDPELSGHPLRVAAYLLHPIGFVLDTLIFRPAHWIVSHEPMATIVGHDVDG